MVSRVKNSGNVMLTKSFVSLHKELVQCRKRSYVTHFYLPCEENGSPP